MAKTNTADGDTIIRTRPYYKTAGHTYKGQFEKTSDGWLYHTGAGYYDLKHAKHYWNLRDRIGSTVAVIDANGNYHQTTAYYPSGTPYQLPNVTLATAVDASTDRLHISNKWMSHSGLNWYDNTARMHDPVLMHFASTDPLYTKYPDFSPWSHCAANPMNIIDPTGCLIRNEDGTLFYMPIGTAKNIICEDDKIIGSADCEIGLVFTNRLLPVLVNKNIDKSQPGFDYNCLGYTLLDGEYWVRDQKSTEYLLSEYKKVSENELDAGDVVTYDVKNTADLKEKFFGEGDFFTKHSAKVKAVDEDNIYTTQKNSNVVGIKNGTVFQGKRDYNPSDIRFWRKIVPDCVIDLDLKNRIEPIFDEVRDFVGGTFKDVKVY